MKTIIYPNDNGSLSVVYPNLACGISLEEIARKDVPEGKPYLIINDNQIPTDHTYFDAFTADFTNPDGYGIGAEAWFAEKLAAETANDSN